MDRVSIRELRNDVSRIVRRANAGERLVVTNHGVAVAEIGPLADDSTERKLQQLFAEGKLNPPKSHARPRPATPVKVDGPSSDEILEDPRRDRL